MKTRLPSADTHSTDIDAFLRDSQGLPQRLQAGQQARLLFAMDATASREPSWTQARRWQAAMFQQAQRSGGLSVQLCFYRGLDELRHSAWLNDSDTLLQAMNKVNCVGGHTQIGRLLGHILREHQRLPLQAAVFIGDAVEENIDSLCQQAGELGVHGVPLFLFQEGCDETAARAFSQMARLSHGAYERFDDHSAARLGDLLGAVAAWASGGREALHRLDSPSARLLLAQLPGESR